MATGESYVNESDKAHYNVGPPAYNPPPRSRALKKYFFLDGKLYRKDFQNRTTNVLKAWCFDTNRVELFVLSDAKRRMKNAYNTKEVALMLNRTPVSIQNHISAGSINSPKRIYQKGMNARGKPFSVMKWSDEDILALHSHLLTSGRGRPRKDGLVLSAPRLPTRKELLAILRNQPMFYMKSSSGEMIPVWSAYDEV